MIQSITSQGLVLYNRNFREDDKLVKIFTEQAGKRMFFVKHAGQSKLAPVIQPLVLARFLLKVNDDGLSYIEDYHEVKTFPKINSDLFVMAYATYVAALADASLQDNQQDAPLFAFLQKTLETISLKSEIKQDLRKFIDQIYEEYVGIHLKSKKFIDSLADWGQLLKEEDK